MRFHDEEVTFNINKSLSTPSHYKDLCIITKVVNDKFWIKDCVLENMDDVKRKIVNDNCNSSRVKKRSKLHL